MSKKNDTKLLKSLDAKDEHNVKQLFVGKDFVNIPIFIDSIFFFGIRDVK